MQTLYIDGAKVATAHLGTNGFDYLINTFDRNRHAHNDNFLHGKIVNRFTNETIWDSYKVDNAAAIDADIWNDEPLWS